MPSAGFQIGWAGVGWEFTRLGKLNSQASSAETSVCSWHREASCFQDNVFKWLRKSFLATTSPREAMFWWLNYKWIRNICSEFPLGLAKHMLDAVLSGILERWFVVFVGSNEASLSQLPFRLWPRVRGQRSQGLCSYVSTSLHKCRMDSLQGCGPLGTETSSTLPPASLFRLNIL